LGIDGGSGPSGRRIVRIAIILGVIRRRTVYRGGHRRSRRIVSVLRVSPIICVRRRSSSGRISAVLRRPAVILGVDDRLRDHTLGGVGGVVLSIMRRRRVVLHELTALLLLLLLLLLLVVLLVLTMVLVAVLGGGRVLSMRRVMLYLL